MNIKVEPITCTIILGVCVSVLGRGIYHSYKHVKDNGWSASNYFSSVFLDALKWTLAISLSKTFFSLSDINTNFSKNEELISICYMYVSVLAYHLIDTILKHMLHTPPVVPAPPAVPLLAPAVPPLLDINKFSPTYFILEGVEDIFRDMKDAVNFAKNSVMQLI